MCVGGYLSVTILWGYAVDSKFHRADAMQGADALDGTAVAILDGWVDSLQHMLTMTYHIFWSQVGLCGALPAQGVLHARIAHSHSFAAARALP